MTISYVGASSVAGNSLTLPTHQAGDLIVLVVFREGTNTAPANVAGWIGAETTQGGLNWLGIYWREAASAATVSGTWTNATHLAAAVYRPAANTRLAISRSTMTGGTAGAGGNIAYAGIAQMSTPDDSWFIGCAGHRSIDTDIQVAPAGMTNRTSVVDGVGELVLHDTNSTQQVWTSTNYVLTAGTSDTYRSITAQIVECAIAAPSGGGGSSSRHPLGRF